MSSRPVVNAGRTLGAVAAVAGLIPILGSAFGWFEWTVEQLEAYTVAVGGVVSAMALFFGVQVEKQVTPVADPRDDTGKPLVVVGDSETGSSSI